MKRSAPTPAPTLRTLRRVVVVAAVLCGLGFARPEGLHAQSMHEAHMAAAADTSVPTQAGQAAFAAISEVVAILAADPDTDWSRVDIKALHDHLMDMERVMVDARVVQAPVADGLEMTVSGSPEVVDAARRMVRAHAMMVGADRGWGVDVQDRGNDLVVRWTTPRPEEVARLRALGFYGFMVDGSHHQRHHLMIAKGMDPHGGEEG
jgi:hypothetical protein